MNIKRVVHRITEELSSTLKIAKVTSFKDAMITLVAKIYIQQMNYNGYYETERMKKFLLKKHEIMIRYYERMFTNFLKDYSYEKKLNYREKKLENKIWICWWQGEENAPKLVKSCIESIKKNAGEHKVILLTDKNYKDYIEIPSWIEEKHKKGIITRTNYSDLLRLSLLAKYGGMWLDATFFCTSSLEKYFNLPLWTIKRPDYGHASVACGYFAGYSLACNYENKWVFEVIRDFFINYWKVNNSMVDYLMIDYMIVLAQRKYKEIAKEFEKVSSNNPLCDELVKILNEPYDELKWKRIKKDTNLFKLTWKQKFLTEINGKKTFYGMLLDDKL